MDENGNSLASLRSLIVLGWVAAALSLIVSPYFALAGIAFGLIANRKVRGSGNYIIAANAALALINLIFGVFLLVALRRMFIWY